MAARRVDVRDVPPGDWPDRWRKSVERLDAMKLLMENGMPDAALVEAVQAAIAAADAFAIRNLGEQCVSERHEDAVQLVERVTGVSGLSDATRHLRRLLLVKGVIEYSGRYPRPEEARQLCEHAKRFVEFVGKNLK